MKAKSNAKPKYNKSYDCPIPPEESYMLYRKLRKKFPPIFKITRKMPFIPS